MYNRRTFLKSGAAGFALAATKWPASPRPTAHSLYAAPIQDDSLKALVQRAIDAALAAGATYADVRLTRMHIRSTLATPDDQEWINAGVRVLVNGCWGFASGLSWHADEITRLAKQAVRQGSAAGIKTERIQLSPVTTKATGHWETPMVIDPFTVPVGEILDFKQSLDSYAKKRVEARGFRFSFSSSWHISVSEEVAFGSTDGSYCTQRLLRSGGTHNWSLINSPVVMDKFPISGAGWEQYVQQPLRDHIDQSIEDAISNASLPEKHLQVGRYDLVLDSPIVAQLLGSTIGLATEADRVMGYEANAKGTSYITNPDEMLGRFRIGSPLLTVTGNRTDPIGAATVKWDDDGVTPDEFTLVNSGVLTDLSTTRESAPWFKDYYTKQGMPVSSHGCARGAKDRFGQGINIPLGWSPNLQMKPSSENLDFDGCVAGVAKGIAFQQLLGFNVDFQQSNGLAYGKAFEIKDGKRVARIPYAGVLFRAQDLWRSLIATGGKQSLQLYGQLASKGEPAQANYYSVSSVPAVFADAAVIDPTRRP